MPERIELLPEDYRQPLLEDPPPLQTKEEKKQKRREYLKKKRKPHLVNPFGKAMHIIPVNKFYEQTDKQELDEALSWAGQDEKVADPKWLQLQSMLANASFRRETFANLCRKLDIRIMDLVEFWRNWKNHQGLLEMMNHVPEVMVDVAEDSKTRIEVCADCDGQGTIWTEEREEDAEKIQIIKRERICRTCSGHGNIRVIGDRHARDHLFEMAGLTNKAKGKSPVVAIQQNFGTGELPDTVGKVSKILEQE